MLYKNVQRILKIGLKSGHTTEYKSVLTWWIWTCFKTGFTIGSWTHNLAIVGSCPDVAFPILQISTVSTI